MYLAIALGVAVLLRSWQASMLAMASVVVACLLAMGAAGWLEIVVSSASAVAPTIITTVAIAYGMHLITGFSRSRSEGRGVRDSVEATLSTNLKPVAVTALTTVVGFLSLNASEAPPFRDLGNITAIGVVATFVLSVTVVPLVLLGWRHAASHPPVLGLAVFSRWVVRQRRVPLIVAMAVLAASAAAIPSMELNDAFVEYFDERVRFRRDTDFVMRRLTGIYQVEYSVKAQGAFGVNDPDYLRQLDRFVAWLESQPEVMHVSAITEILKRLNRHVGGGSMVLPESRDQAAQYLLLYEMSVPYGLDLNDRLSVDRSASRVTVTLRNLDNATLRLFEERADRWLAGNVPPYMNSGAAGAAVMFAYIAERNIRAMLVGTLLAIVVIAVCLSGIFRSVRIGLLTMLPNVVPAVIAFGIWSLLVGQMGVALAVVAAMSLGIVVDDTVHFTSSFRQARNDWRFSPEEAVQHAFTATGTALASTSIVLILGFGVLSLSAFQVNHGMGQLTSLIIACALAADFLMLPALLIAAARKGWV
jgi:predicted RND superfamily exporter protein